MAIVKRNAAPAILAAAASLAGVAAARAQATGDFAHKTITVYIGNTAGGSYDQYGRMLARFLGKHLPGDPTIVATNMPGAGTLKAASFLYNVAPKDGTAIGIVTETLPLEQATRNPGSQYDAAKFEWIGRMASSNNIHMQWHTAKVQSVEEALKTETPVAAAGVGNISETVPTVLNSVLKTKFKVIAGYPASAEAMLAMERGEVEGAATSWETVKTTKKDWLEQKKIKIILQDVPERSAELPDVPALGELGSTPADKQLLGLYASGGVLGRAFLAPPGTPPAALKALREGFDAMVRDPEVVAEMRRAGLDLNPLGADALHAATLKVLQAPEDVKTRASAVFGR